MTGLTQEEARFILESLAFTKRSFQNYRYPTPELRTEQLDTADRVMAKVRAIRDARA